MELIEVLRNLESPPKYAWAVAFIMSDHIQDLFSYVDIHPLHSNVEALTPREYQIREVMIEKPTLDTTQPMVTIAIKEVFKTLEWDGVELITLW